MGVEGFDSFFLPEAATWIGPWDGCTGRGDVKGDAQYGTGNVGEAGIAAASPAVAPSPTLEPGVATGGFAGQVQAELAPTVRAFGFELVELAAARLARRSLIRLVVYRADGMVVDDCAKLARAIRYQLALLPGAEDARLEVSTPGTARVLKAAHEYTIFRGRTVEVLVDDEWLRGIITADQNGIITLDSGTDERQIELRWIRKGRLSDDMIDRSSDGDETDGQ